MSMNTIVYAATPLAKLLIVVSLVICAKPIDYAQAKDTPARFTIQVWTDTTDYLEGESIVLHYQVSSPVLTQNYWTPFHVQPCINVEAMDGSDIEAVQISMDLPPTGSLDSTFESALQLNGDHRSTETKTSDNFPHLLPGQYSAKYGCQPQSNIQYFRVHSVPDSVSSIWNVYKRLRTIQSHPHQTSIRVNTELDSIDYWSAYLGDLPENSAFRSEGLASCATLYGRYRSHWTVQDSLACFRTLVELSEEEEMDGLDIVALSLGSLLKTTDRVQLASALRAIASEMSKSKVMEATESYLSQEDN